MTTKQPDRIAEQMSEHVLDALAREMETARQSYINACESLARSLTEAASAAKREEHRYVSSTVMSSSVVLDVTREAQRYETLGRALQEVRTAHAFVQR